MLVFELCTVQPVYYRNIIPAVYSSRIAWPVLAFPSKDPNSDSSGDFGII